MTQSKKNNCRMQAMIFARGGSKGVPGKNIKPLADKPLIAYAIEIARAAPSLGSVVVSTDCERIAEIARNYGAEVPFIRPAELAQDGSAELRAWRHAIEWMERQGRYFEYMVSLPTTSPFRAVEDVENCISLMVQDDKTDVVISVTDAARSPYFNMVALQPNQHASLLMPSQFTRRQDAPIAMDMTTVCYVVKVEFVKKCNSLFDGNVRAQYVPVERALDIDTPFDFLLAELLAEHNQKMESE